MRIWMTRLVCAVAVSLSACAEPEPVDEEPVGDAEEADVSTFCPDGHACFWPLQYYGGNRQEMGAWYDQDWTYPNGTYEQNYHSLKNRFTSRAVWTRKTNQQPHCTPPNGEDATAPEFSWFCIGPQGSTCGWNPFNWCIP